MNKKLENASPITASVATASVVATRTLTSSTTTRQGMPASNKTTAKVTLSNTKSHPKTLDIPDTPTKKSTSISAALLTNGVTSTQSKKADKEAVPTPVTITVHNKMVSDSPRRVIGGDDNGFREKQKAIQNNISPTSSLSPSSSSSSPSSASTSSGIHAAQFAAICREVANVREEHLSIRKSLSERDGELSKTRMTLKNIAQERDILRNKVSELEHILKASPETYSHVASILSNNQNLITAPQPSFQTTSSASMPSSSNHTPEEISTTVTSPSKGKNSISNGHYAPLSAAMKNNTIFSSPVRSIVQKQQQNQQLTSLPSSNSSSHLRPNIVSASAAIAGGNFAAETIGSPRKCNGNEGNLGRKGCIVGVGGMEETQKIGGGGGRVGGGNGLPCSPRSSSPIISNNINSQESHQASHNNKNLHQQQRQHSIQQQQQNNYYYMNNMKQTTTTFTTIPADKNKSIYYSHHEQGPRGTPPPPLSLQYLEYHNGNGRNVNGNDIPAMTNSNNNNNHPKSTSAGGGGGGGGGGAYLQHDYHQNQHHLSQSGITGLDLMLLGPDCSTKVVEHLVHPVAIESSVREIQHTLVLKGVPLNGDRLREVEIEIDRLNSRIDHLRSQNDVLTLNLEDAKGHADRLTVLLGKYESNNVALQLALRYSDQMSNAYEVLLALLETELGQVVTSIHAAGQLHLICTTPGITSAGNTSASVAPKSTITSSGNNNNSNDNSPSEHAQLSPSPAAAKGGNKNKANINILTSINGKYPENSMKHENTDSQDDDYFSKGVDEQRKNQSGNNNNGCCSGHENAVGGNNSDHHNSPDNNNCTTTVAVTSPKGSSEMMMVPVKNCNDPDKIISPTSPSTPPSSTSTKAMNLVEQARRNRLAAEQAARFLLSRFSSASMHSFSHGIVTSPTGSNDNNGRNGSGDGNSFILRPACQSNSTTSINSVSSNLSNLSGGSDGAGRESLSLSSPATEVKEAEKQEKLREIQNEYDLEKVKQQTSSSTKDEVTDGKEVAIAGENMKSSSGAVESNSPTSSSSTFRAQFTPNGNGPLNGTTPIITSLLPLLRSAAAAAHQQSNHPNNGPSQEAVSAAIESTIRRLISTLKAERDAVKQTVMELESESLESLTPSPKPSSPYYGNGNNNNNNRSSSNATPTAAWSPADARKLDLETAVLMQELMAMKEERAELRAQLFLLEKEKGSLELRLRSHESQEEAYRARINYLKSEIMDCKSLHSATPVTTTMDTFHQDRNRNDILKSQQQQQQQQQNNGNNRNLETIINNNNNNQNVNWEREALLKKRIHELAATLEKVTVGSQVREKQNQEMINELNRANGILMQTLDVAKKKYQNRIKKMEDQILYVSERHAAQLKLFGEKVPRQYHS